MIDFAKTADFEVLGVQFSMREISAHDWLAHVSTSAAGVASERGTPAHEAETTLAFSIACVACAIAGDAKFEGAGIDKVKEWLRTQPSHVVYEMFDHVDALNKITEQANTLGKSPA